MTQPHNPIDPDTVAEIAPGRAEPGSVEYGGSEIHADGAGSGSRVHRRFVDRLHDDGGRHVRGPARRRGRPGRVGSGHAQGCAPGGLRTLPCGARAVSGRRLSLG